MTNAVSDEDLDRLFPKAVQKLARAQWTPAKVAMRVVPWLAERGKVLDVGAGCGKLCLVGGMTTKAHFTGVEIDAELVAHAKAAAKAAKVQSVRFLAGDALVMSWASYGALYFFNPFSGAEDQYVAAIEETKRRLEAAPAGTRVATYFGYGGEMPVSYDQAASERFGAGLLELWEKR